MQVNLTRIDGSAVHTVLDLRPVRYSAAALGGPDMAEIAVVATSDNKPLSDVLTWLACHVVICNDDGLPVWWGLVQSVAVTLDGVEYGVDAGQVVNRMGVIYIDANSQAQVTAWVEDAHSIALYGRREMRVTALAETNTTAIAQATRIVSERSTPLRSVAASGAASGARLTCVGYWRSLDWRFWSQAAGQLERDLDANTTELLGWRISGTQIGFNRPLMRIGTLGAALHPLAESDRVVATGSGSNNGVYEVTATDERTAVTSYTHDGISFDTSDDVHDDEETFNQFQAGDLLQISGATEAGNNGNFWLKDMFQGGSGGYEHMRVYPGSIVDEAAGATITIAAGNSVEVAQRPAAYEMPGWTITLDSQAQKVAMIVTLGQDEGALSEIWLRAARIGAPADNLKIEWCDPTSGGPPGAVLKSATVVGASLPLLESMDWVQWQFDHGEVMAPGTYWLVVSRTGSFDDDAYRLGLYEGESGFTSADVLLLYDGSDWIEREVASGHDAALSLRIYGQRETTAQVADIVAGVGDWLVGCEVREADSSARSSLRTRYYRAETDAQTALSEIKGLLEFGTAGGARLLAHVTVDRVLFVEQQKSSAQPGCKWAAGELRDRFGLRLPAGWLPVGEWVAFDASDAFPPAFLEAAEFDVASGAVRPSFRAEQPVQSLARLANSANVQELAARLRPLL
jgi:hypothetical protein